MSRAFVKEAEEHDPRCPAPDGCGGIGQPVADTTLVAQLGAEAAAHFHAQAFYCPDPHCPVAYFDGFGTRVPSTALKTHAWPKHAGAPVCACFGVTAEQIEEWAHSGDKAKMRELLARVEGPEARCAVRAPDGRSCEPELRRVFLKALGLTGG